MSRIRVLIAEDDPALRAGLVDALDQEGYVALGARDGGEALALCERQSFDLLILDVMMPVQSGYDVCRALRAKGKRLPILMLTAKGEEVDKVLGLELGADDYVTKPFSLRELTARVHALLRRARRPEEEATSAELADSFSFAGGRVQRREFTFTRGRQTLALSAREVKLVETFARHPREVLSRDELLNAGWGIAYLGTTRTLDQHIAQLRKKIEAHADRPVHILTVHGVGYKYVPS
jgi:DNA-binding response OmpR family regulator